ncbi:unnamed protein product, partial [marine sediment metagenome]
MRQLPRETNINSLRRVLELECKKGYSNKAVIGGLDRFLRKQEGKIVQDANDRELLTSFNNLGLAKSNYSSWDVKKRKQWIATILQWIDEVEQTKGRKKSSTLASDRLTVVAKTRQMRRVSYGLDSSITSVKGITTNTATRFAKLGVRTIYDLLLLP